MDDNVRGLILAREDLRRDRAALNEQRAALYQAVQDGRL